jgi:PAS domain S-box-containing protein
MSIKNARSGFSRMAERPGKYARSMPRAITGHDIHGKLQFGPFELSSGERMLRRGGVMLPLGGRAIDILIYLAKRPGEVVTKRELIDYVWSDVTVEEGSLRVHVAAIRKVLGDGQCGNRYIANIKGRGYAFVGIVVPLACSTESRNAKFLHQGWPSVRSLTMIGHEMVVSEVSDKLRYERFVTPPDLSHIGKTAMHPAVGHAVAKEFGGDVCFAELESLTDRCRITGTVSSAMEVNLSPKRVKSRTRARKLDRTKAKPGIPRARKSRAELEGELKACRRETAHARKRLAEATVQQTATSEMLRLISNSPIQSVLDAVAEHAARLCQASNARIWRLEDNILRLVASYGESSATMDGREGLPTDRDTVTGRAACDRRTIHVRDIAAEVSEYPVGSRVVQGQGWHTTLATPLLREGTPIGVILVRRMEVRPFYDRQIALLETFAGQAAIAIENVRLFESGKQRSLALALANRNLAEREAKIRRLVDSNIIGIFVWDFDGRILEANDEFLRMVNYDREDLVSGRIRWADLTPPDWRDRNNARIGRQKSSGRFEPFEKEYTRKDGSRVPVLIGGATFEEGGSQGVAFVLDLTERKRGEDALRERETQLAEARRELRQMIDTIPIPLASYSAEARRDFVNAAWKQYTGLSDEAALGTEWSVVAHPDHIATGEKMWRDALAAGVPWHTEERVRRADGQYRWFAIDRVAARDENGKIIKWYGTAYDIEDRKRAEDALRDSEAKFRDYAETASDWFWEIGPDCKFTLLTENAFRSNSGDRIGTLCWDHALDLETEPEKWRLLWTTLDSRTPFRDFVYCTVDGSGSPMYVRVSGKPVFDANGEFRGYRGTGTDVTALRTIEAQARENERRYREAQLELAHANRVATMGQLTSSIAHEVNQPITAAVTYALAARRFLSAEPPNFLEVDDALSLIVKEGNRAGEVVARIRALIKKAPARKDAVVVNDAILEVIALTRTEAANNGVSVRTELAEGLPHVQGDRVQLQQVLLNLIINAIEAMREVGEAERELLISTRHEPGGVSVEVRDSGPGFTPAVLDRVFEAFYTTKPGGLGLGLSICRSIIEAHNGRLWAGPNVPRGAIFRFTASAYPAATS